MRQEARGNKEVPLPHAQSMPTCLQYITTAELYARTEMKLELQKLKGLRSIVTCGGDHRSLDQRLGGGGAWVELDRGAGRVNGRAAR